VTVLEGIRRKVGSNTRVAHARGCGVFELDTSGISEAVEIARASDVAVMVLGESREVCDEGVDQHDLGLPGVQMDLVRAVYETGTPTVVVLVNGRPLSIEWIADHVPAILETWFAGEEGGNALADVLFGDFNPCGKLPVSFPKSVGHVPAFYNHKPSARGYYRSPGEPGKPGRDYVFSSPAPLYEFGYGLSYTVFKYSNLHVSPAKIPPAAKATVSVTITNAGSRSGSEVVQLYINDLCSSVTTPVKALRGFKKVTLEPGESRVVEFVLEPRHLAFLDRHMEWVVEPGEFEVTVGGLKETLRVVTD